MPYKDLEKRREVNRKWREAHPEYAKRWRDKHPEYPYNKWAKANPDKRREVQRKWRQQNPDKASECTMLWQKRHLDRVRAARRKWGHVNLDKLRAYNHKRRDRTKGSWTVKEWQALKRGYGNRCVGCWKYELQLLILGCMLVPDHIVPLSKGGLNDITNLQPLCHGKGGCNNKKGNKYYDFVIS